MMTILFLKIYQQINQKQLSQPVKSFDLLMQFLQSERKVTNRKLAR